MCNYIFISIKYNINFPKKHFHVLDNHKTKIYEMILNLNKDCSIWNFYKLFASLDPLIISNKSHVFLRIA